jgi:signal peptide peptidase SppA
MKLARVLSKINLRPWAIEEGGQRAVAALLKAKLARAEDDNEGPEIEPFVNVRKPMYMDGQGIAHIHIDGVMAKGISKLEAICGGYDYEWLEQDLSEANEQGCRGVWIEFDTPGGSCEGLAECADMIAETARRVPVIAWTDQTIASAGYFLASSCTKIFASRSAMVGSIGVIIGWIDASMAWQAEGLRWDPVISGPLKGAGMGPSLTPEQRASLQRLVDDSYNLFKDNILRNRKVPDEAMQGELYLSGRAKSYNLIDSNQLTEQQAYETLVSLVG